MHFSSVAAGWTTDPDGVMSCWNVTVLQDFNNGWNAACLGLSPRPQYISINSCRQECQRDVWCPAWQFNNGPNTKCWWGHGSQCEGQDTVRDGEVIGGQRVLHGNVIIRKNLQDYQAEGLYHVGLVEHGNRSECLRRCRNMCYSDSNCTVWQYGVDGCWVERSPGHVFGGVLHSHSEWALTSVGGEQIRHECLPRPVAAQGVGPGPASVGATGLAVVRAMETARLGFDERARPSSRAVFLMSAAAAMFVAAGCIALVAMQSGQTAATDADLEAEMALVAEDAEEQSQTTMLSDPCAFANPSSSALFVRANKSQVDSSSEEEEQVPNQQDSNKLQVPSRPTSAMNASQHSGEELLQNNRDSPNLSLPSIYEGRNSSTPLTIENVEELRSQRSKHGLPEDQEIIDEEEEEEEDV